MKKINRKILIVDDDPEVLGTFETILVEQETTKASELVKFLTELAIEENEGELIVEEAMDNFELHTADSASGAIEIFKKAIKENNPFSVVFMDVRIPPGINGLECAQQLRGLDPWFYLVVVTAYSDYSMEEMKERFENNFLFLHKPFQKNALLQIARHFTWLWSRDQQLRKEVSQLKNELSRTSQ